MDGLRQRDRPQPIPRPPRNPPAPQPTIRTIRRFVQRYINPFRPLIFALVLALVSFILAVSTFFSPLAFIHRHLSLQNPTDIQDVQNGWVVKYRLGEEESGQYLRDGQVIGHADFGDGRSRVCNEEFVQPESQALGWVNVMLGNGGPEPNLSGGMIPAVSPPFGMTRWSPQTRKNYVSMCPYNQTDTKLHGFIATHQPAIWMGESGPVEISPGLGTTIITDFDKRGLPFKREDEYASANYYRNLLDAGDNGEIQVEMSATSRVGHLRFTFNPSPASPSYANPSRPRAKPYITLQSSRATYLVHGDKPDDRVSYFPKGFVEIDVQKQEVRGWNDERQDRILVGTALPASNFKTYYVARFSTPFKTFGISHHGQIERGLGETRGEGEVLAGWVGFEEEEVMVDVKVGVSFISVEQAGRNIDLEISRNQSLSTTSYQTRSLWAEKLDRLAVSGATPHNLTVLYTSTAHTLVYPYEIHECVPVDQDAEGKAKGKDEWQYFSGYLNHPTPGLSYSGYSLWDTFRAQTAWLLLLAPSVVPSMLASMLQDYREGGRLPMWKNLVETNIMVGTHADAVLAQAMRAGVEDFGGFGKEKVWEAVREDAFTPPERDTELREEGTPQEARAGLTEYMALGYVAADLHSEAGSRTLDYAYDDHAAAIIATHLSLPASTIDLLRNRSLSYKNMWNAEKGFMESRNSDGSWAGEDEGWTEGDHWAYSLDVMHDVPGLIELMGGNQTFIDFMNRHFDEGHNLHTNEPSHHIPYLYIFAGAPYKTQEWVRSLGRSEYNHTAAGLSGNEDCGQMSAWYIFSALGVYPVDPASAKYVLGAPFFDKITLRLPRAPWYDGDDTREEKVWEVVAEGASEGKVYVKSLKIEGHEMEEVEVGHDILVKGGKWIWEMEETPQVWGM
ncbi:alpha-1,2-mannosidase [Cryptococcus gattii E566]|uniref:Alpha-1,2-mannosidase, putative n=2 Tax=Cryptococcus gattii TaxID=37769 RepID=E6RAF3_CRYGW|nr:alpha-1,2-mannosidase, putative [Cryptococcus gattii WM276]ADV23805.1 alpha-1,2-mannosidase, putative [Cryptococcus gattii WM276]KIR81520.1 alpha-1,2-mannosidase [Cryptococcus gattii EJB2]KIY31782.1 alpha-1,2-mannosidase [Cryptococcus gattii E566]KJE02261.1 alpha-1,2-mannosidase [Cryptococcus gattii NT-10]